jgi:hypothetical protein
MAESLTHPVFGKLKWEENNLWWFTQIRQESGEWLDVIVDPGDDDPSVFVERASQLYRQAMNAERELLQKAIKEKLLDLYETWRQEDEPKLTAEELQDQLELTFVRIDTVIPITLSYDLGDVFGGHSVDVEVDRQLQFVRANLVG